MIGNRTFEGKTTTVFRRNDYLCQQMNSYPNTMSSFFALIASQSSKIIRQAFCLGGLFLLVFPVSAVTRNVDSLLLVLDKYVAQRNYYEQKFLQSSDSLRRKASTSSGYEALRLWTELSAEEFRHSGKESLDAIGRALTLARQLKDKQAEVDLLQRKSIVLGMMGFPWEGEHILDSLKANPILMQYARRKIYSTYYDLHDFYQAYNMPGELSDPKYAFLSTIEDSVRQQLTDPARQAMSIHYTTYDERQMIKDLEAYLEKSSEEMKGLVATVISNKYFLIRDINSRNYYWALASIYNIKVARHENEALTRLAIHLFETGDTERAIRYILAAYDDARIYDTRIRKVEASAPLASGLAKEAKQNRSLRNRITTWQLVAAGLFLLLAMTAMLFIRLHRRQEKVRDEHDRLIITHHNLIEKLRGESDVKSEYITRFLELSLDSIFQIEQLRNLILVKAKSEDTKRIIKILNDPTRFDDFRRICLQRFDIAFLQLYPNFIQAGNALLSPEEQIKLPDTEILSNELRVLAFMKLGISDSPRIATILGVSTNTIYFYRNKMRRKAIDRKNFEKAIMDIH